MSHILKSFAELAWPVVAVAPIHNRVSLQLLALSPQAIVPAVAVPLEHATGRPPRHLMDAGGWHHGGINE